MMNINDFKKVAIYEFDTSIPTFSYTAATEIGKTGSYALITFGGKPYRVEIDSATGKLNWTAPEAVKDGSYSFSLVIVDRAGNHSQPGLATFVVDTTPPEAPQVLSIHDNAGNESYFQPGGTSDDKTPTLTGIAQKGSTVYLKNDKGETIGTAVADKETGKWEIIPTVELQDGANSLTLVAVEKFAGAFREGVPTQPFVINVAADVDKTPVDLKIVDADDNVGNSKGSVKSGATTDDDTPTLRGTVSTDQEVTIQYRQTGTSIWMTATATTSGKAWSWTPSQALALGEWEFRALADGKSSELFTLNISGSPETLVNITHAFDDAGLYIGELAHGAITDDSTPELHGRAEANGTVYLFYRAANSDIWTAMGTATAGADGQWKITPNELANGKVEFKATATNDVNAPGSTFGLTLIDPGSNVPVITGAWDDAGSYKGLIKNGYTDDTTPTLRGIAEANSHVIVEYSSAGKNYSATVQVGKDGNWEFTPPELELGRWIFKAKTSSAGAWSKTYALNVLEYEFQEKEEDFSDVYFAQGSIANGGISSYVTDNGLKIIYDYSNGLLAGEIAYGNVRIYEKTKPQFEIPPSESFSLDLIRQLKTGTLFVTVYNTAGVEMETVEVIVDQSFKYVYKTNSDDLIGGFKIASNIGYSDSIFLNRVQWKGLDSGMENERSWGEVADSQVSKQIGAYMTDIGDRATAIASIDVSTGNAKTSGMGSQSLNLFGNTNLEFDFRGAEKFSFDLSNEDAGTVVNVAIYDVHNNLIEEVAYPIDKKNTRETFTYSASNGEIIGRVAVGTKSHAFLDNLKWKSAPDSLRTIETSIELKFEENHYSREKILDGVTLTSDLGAMYYSGSTVNDFIYLHGEQNLQFSLPKESNYVHLVTHQLNSSSFVTFYNADGVEIGRGNNGMNVTTFFAPEGEAISYFIVTNTNASPGRGDQTGVKALNVRYIDEQPDYVQPFSVVDDSIRAISDVEDLASHALVGSEERIDTLELTGKAHLLDLSANPDYIDSIEIIDLTGTGDNTLRIDLNALLQHGEKDLFIEDGKTQMVVKGNEGDVVQLADILPEGGHISEWQHMDGTVTVAGVEYQVYSHGEDAELLVQQGVKTELI